MVPPERGGRREPPVDLRRFGSFVLFTDHSQLLYAKQFLHPGETQQKNAKALILKGLRGVYGCRELFQAQFAPGIPRTEKPSVDASGSTVRGRR